MMLSLSVVDSFVVFTSLLISLPFLGHTANQFYQRPESNRLYQYWGNLFCVILIFSLIFGTRNEVGIDYLSYKKIYEVIQSGEIPDDIIEPGFYCICKFLGALGLHYSFFFGFSCCLQVFFNNLAF